MMFQTGSDIKADPRLVFPDQFGHLNNHIRIDAGLCFHHLRGELPGIRRDFFHADTVALDKRLIITARLDQLVNEPPGQGAVGSRNGLSENVGIAGNGIQTRVHHHQIGPSGFGIRKFRHERRMADRRIGAEEKNQTCPGIVRKRIPEPGNQIVSQKTAVETG